MMLSQKFMVQRNLMLTRSISVELTKEMRVLIWAAQGLTPAFGRYGVQTFAVDLWIYYR